MTAVIIASLCLSWQLVSAHAQAWFTRDVTPETIDILVTNQAVVTTPVLRAAEDVASRIFRDAGIEIRWTEEVTPNPVFSMAMYAEDGQSRRDAIFSTDGPFARTLRTRHVLGGRTSVFYDRILAHALATHRNLTHLLGTVMAHEIGHMLLPEMRHSGSGLMRSGWDDEDLTHADLGALRLMPEQVDQIHAHLSQAQALSLQTCRACP